MPRPFFLGKPQDTTLDYTVLNNDLAQIAAMQPGDTQFIKAVEVGERIFAARDYLLPDTIKALSASQQNLASSAFALSKIPDRMQTVLFDTKLGEPINIGEFRVHKEKTEDGVVFHAGLPSGAFGLLSSTVLRFTANNGIVLNGVGSAKKVRDLVARLG